MRIYVKFSLVLPRSLTKYGEVTQLKLQISKSFILTLLYIELYEKSPNVVKIGSRTKSYKAKNKILGGKQPSSVLIG